MLICRLQVQLSLTYCSPASLTTGSKDCVCLAALYHCKTRPAPGLSNSIQTELCVVVQRVWQIHQPFILGTSAQEGRPEVLGVANQDSQRLGACNSPGA